MVSTGLQEATSVGVFFTWSNGSSYSRLDRALVNQEWILTMNYIAKTLSPGLSDHSLVLLDKQGMLQAKRRQFKYCDMWANDDNFIDIISKGWSIDVSGSPSYIVSQKLKEIKRSLKQLHSQKYGNMQRKCEDARSQLEEWQVLQSKFFQDPIVAAISHEARKEYMEKLQEYLTLMHQQSKLDWSLEGDTCSKRFMSYVKIRKQKLIVNDRTTICDRLVQYFKSAGYLSEHYRFGFYCPSIRPYSFTPRS